VPLPELNVEPSIVPLLDPEDDPLDDELLLEDEHNPA
jgi:hypothetical protein